MSARPRLPAGFTLRAYDRLPSTNDKAKRLAAEGAPHRTIVWAREQTAGRGRRGRAWDSPAGNLYLSFLLRIAIPVERATQAGFVAAVALAETAERFLPSTSAVRCKWPNDVLVDDRKAAGILLESALSADGGLDWLVVGCGLNCASHPDDGRWPATDLASAGGRVPSVAAVLGRLAGALDGWLARWQNDGFAPVRDAWLDRGWGLGRALRLLQGDDDAIEGRFVGLADDGALVLDRDDGKVEAIRSGEITVAEP